MTIDEAAATILLLTQGAGPAVIKANPNFYAQVKQVLEQVKDNDRLAD